MRKTYAYNSIIIGVLLGMLVGIKAGTVLGIIVGIAVSVVGFFIIRAIENVLYKGADAAEKAIKTAIKNKKDEKVQAEAEMKICPNCGSKQSKDATFCRSCGPKLN